MTFVIGFLQIVVPNLIPWMSCLQGQRSGGENSALIHLIHPSAQYVSEKTDIDQIIHILSFVKRVLSFQKGCLTIT